MERNFGRRGFLKKLLFGGLAASIFQKRASAAVDSDDLPLWLKLRQEHGFSGPDDDRHLRGNPGAEEADISHIFPSRCVSTCEKTCEGSCEKACQVTCETACQAACETVCMTTCEKACQNSCEASCQNGCETNCQISCQSSSE